MSDLVTFAIIVENQGQGLNGANNILVTDDLPDGFTVPSGGIGLCVTDGTGTTDLTYSAYGGGSGLLDKGIEIDTLAAGIDPQGDEVTSGHNIAVLTFNLQLGTNAVLGTTYTNTASLVSYAGKSSGPNHVETGKPLQDIAETTLVQPSLTKSTPDTQATIGQVVTYTVTATLPDGALPGATITDTLPSGLAFKSCTGIAAPNLTTSLAGGFSQACTSPTVQDTGHTVTFNLGNVSHTTNNNTNQTVAITYEAVVLNAEANFRGTDLRNSATLSYTGGTDITAAADLITLVEPGLTVTKSLTPSSGDAGDLIDPASG